MVSSIVTAGISGEVRRRSCISVIFSRAASVSASRGKPSLDRGLGYRRRDTSLPGVVQDGLTKSVGISHRLEEQDVALNGTSPDMVHRFWRRRKNRRFMAGANCISLSTQTCRDETLGMLTSPSRFAQPLLVPSHEPHHIITKWEAAMEYRDYGASHGVGSDERERVRCERF